MKKKTRKFAENRCTYRLYKRQDERETNRNKIASQNENSSSIASICIKENVIEMNVVYMFLFIFVVV